VKIVCLHGDETLREYDAVIDLPFDTKTATGQEIGKRMAILTMREGLSTEEVLFTIASDQIHTHAVEELAQLANTEILQCASGYGLHVRVLPNGDISCRMPMKN
jgi:hypothetical protein